MTYTPLRDVRKKVAALEEFNSNSLWATLHPGGVRRRPDWGRGAYGPEAGAIYIVWSYETPIAWIDRLGRAHRTPEKFSVTTSKHMGMLGTLADLTFAQRSELLGTYIVREAYEPV